MLQRLTMTAAALLAEQPTSICIGTITRDRPRMLQNLLDSYSKMRVPGDVKLRFVIVENNDKFTLQDVVGRFRETIPQWEVQYELEPCLGIAFARNRVLNCALRAADDLLTFVDDDETVDQEWLVQLLAERDANDLDIVSSPVRIAPITPGASFWRRLIWSGIDRINRNSEAKLLLRRNKSKVEGIPSATGSWMGSVPFFRRTGLRFDTTFGFAGGEDVFLWIEARKLGARTGWTPYAIAYETMPEERLSLLYLYRRSRDETTAKFRNVLDGNRGNGLLLIQLASSLACRVLSFWFCLAAIPLTRGQTLVRAVWHLGSVAGILQACVGRSSRHYERVTGY